GSPTAAARSTRGRALELPRLPDLLRRPAVRPLSRHPVVPRLRPLGRRLELDEILDLEAVRAQQPDPLAVAEMKVDPVRPVEAAHAEVVAHKLALPRPIVRQHREDTVAQEDQLTARPQEPRRLG